MPLAVNSHPTTVKLCKRQSVVGDVFERCQFSASSCFNVWRHRPHASRASSWQSCQVRRRIRKGEKMKSGRRKGNKVGSRKKKIQKRGSWEDREDWRWEGNYKAVGEEEHERGQGIFGVSPILIARPRQSAVKYGQKDFESTTLT